MKIIDEQTEDGFYHLELNILISRRQEINIDVEVEKIASALGDGSSTIAIFPVSPIKNSK